MTDQANQPVAQVAAFEQHGDHEHDHHAGGTERCEERTEPREAGKAGRWFGLDHHGLRRSTLGDIRLAEVGLDVLDRLLQLFDRAALAGAAHVVDLREDVDAIGGQIVGEVFELPLESPAGEAEHHEHQRHYHDHRRTRPSHRSSQVTGGVSTNEIRNARAIGTSTVCAQYKTTITSTVPAKVIQGFNELDASSMHATR